MQLTLTQKEIEVALEQYVSKHLRMLGDNPMTIELRAGRGADGFTATIDIDADAPSKPAKTVLRSVSSEEAPVTREVETSPVEEDASESVYDEQVEDASDAAGEDAREEEAAQEPENPAPKRASIFNKTGA